MSEFDSVSNSIKAKLAVDRVTMVDDLPDFEDVLAWNRLERVCGLTGPEFNAIRKAIKPSATRGTTLSYSLGVNSLLDFGWWFLRPYLLRKVNLTIPMDTLKPLSMYENCCKSLVGVDKAVEEAVNFITYHIRMETTPAYRKTLYMIAEEKLP